MTTYTAWWEEDEAALTEAGDAQTAIERAAAVFYPHGGRGIRIVVGLASTGQAEAPLQIDIDIDEGRARLMWLPDGEVGAEDGAAPHHRDLQVQTEADEETVAIPGRECLVTPRFAAETAEEYVETGKRPTCVSWRSRD